MESLNEVITNGLISERKRSERVIKTPKIIIRERASASQGDYRYYYTWLGKVRVWKFTDGGKTHRQVSYLNAQTFRDGIVRYVTPEVEYEIEKIDADIKALQDKRKQLLKDKFLWLHAVTYETIEETQEKVR